MPPLSVAFLSGAVQKLTHLYPCDGKRIDRLGWMIIGQDEPLDPPDT